MFEFIKKMLIVLSVVVQEPATEVFTPFLTKGLTT